MQHIEPDQPKKPILTAPILTPELIEPDSTGKLHIFRDVALESVWGLVEHCPVKSLAIDEPLMEKNQDNTHLYIVLQGELQVFLDADFTQAVATLTSGQTVGELSVIADAMFLQLLPKLGFQNRFGCLDIV